MRKSTQAKKLEALLGKLATVNGTTVEEIKEKGNLDSLYSYEEHVYEAQAILNFFGARVKPFLEKGESPVNFDKRYKEWRIKECRSCSDHFAYAYAFDGVSCCSLDCLDDELRRIGLQVTRGRDLKRRWSVHYHPAIVSSGALKALKQLYSDDAPEAFALSQ